MGLTSAKMERLTILAVRVPALHIAWKASAAPEAGFLSGRLSLMALV